MAVPESDFRKLKAILWRAHAFEPLGYALGLRLREPDAAALRLRAVVMLLRLLPDPAGSDRSALAEAIFGPAFTAEQRELISAALRKLAEHPEADADETESDETESDDAESDETESDRADAADAADAAKDGCDDGDEAELLRRVGRLGERGLTLDNSKKRGAARRGAARRGLRRPEKIGCPFPANGAAKGPTQ